MPFLLNFSKKYLLSHFEVLKFVIPKVLNVGSPPTVLNEAIINVKRFRNLNLTSSA